MKNTSKNRGSQAAFVESRVALARLFHVDARTITRWIGDSAPPKGAKGYDVPAWRAWAADRRGTATAHGESAAQADRRYQVARAGLKELELAKAAGTMILVADAERMHLEWIKWFIGCMERAGPELAPKVAGRKFSEIKKVVTAYFNEIRNDRVAWMNKSLKARERRKKKAGKPQSQRRGGSR